MLQHIADIQSRLCGNRRAILRGDSDDILYLAAHTVYIRARQVYFVYDRNYLEIVFKRKISICQSLRFYSLRRVDDEKRTLASLKRTGNLIVEVDMSGGIDEIEFICLAVCRLVIYLDSAGFYCYSAFALYIHIVEELVLHIALGNTLR